MPRVTINFNTASGRCAAMRTSSLRNRVALGAAIFKRRQASLSRSK
jgi:hypothetical protein